MKTLLNRWNTIWLRPLTDGEALKVLDDYNKTRYSRRKKQDGLLELASREAHEKQEVYFPYCAIESNVGYFGVDFLGEDLDNYLIYTFRDFTQEGRRYSWIPLGYNPRIRKTMIRFIALCFTLMRIKHGES